jgi:glycosyltransferase involved in cell wall biosynthesis
LQKEEVMIDKINPSVLFVSTYPPRECGIATFTKDISEAMNRLFFPSLRSNILAINDNGTNIYNYSKKVVEQISDNEITDYLEVAKKINNSKQIKIVNIQHEFAIFGGEYGNFIIPFLEMIKKPVVITFHSVLPGPDEKLKKVTFEISKRVRAIIVMTKKAVRILREDYGIKAPIHVIPHGIPNVPLELQIKEKKNLGLNGRKVLLTFGMVGPGKGYEHVIESLSKIVEKHPDLLYIVVGETHPGVRKKDGELYRNKLESRVKELKLQKHIKFYNKYVSISEIIQYLKACDVYVCTPDNPNQITSGTLVYAMGCGRAIVSTSFLHAQDIVTENRGRLVDFKDSEGIANAIDEILLNENLRRDMERNNYYFTRHMTWSNVAASYGRVFKEILLEEGTEIQEFPKINIKHLMKMTDRFGIIQFADQDSPDFNSGYTLDDNARALLTCAMYFERFGEYRQLKMIKTYLDYINHVKADDGRLYNFVDKNRRVDMGRWSEDAHGRALWALGYVSSLEKIPKDLRNRAENIFLESLGVLSEIYSPRALAFAISGLFFYNRKRGSSTILKNIKKLADYLVSYFRANAKEEWRWFEPYLTYSNSKLSEALFYAYSATNNQYYLDLAKESLDFLISQTFNNGIFVPIGQKKWYYRGEERSKFDQQPVDVGYTVQTLMAAYNVTKDEKYRRYALNAFQWFMGDNLLNQVIYNESTGGCHDGLGESSINLNQGAESTISYLIGRLSIME